MLQIINEVIINDETVREEVTQTAVELLGEDKVQISEAPVFGFAADDFAEYLATVSEHFTNDWGVKIQSITAMNEPYTNYWGAYSAKQEGCHVSAGTSQSRVLLSLRRALDEKGLNDVLISASDETSIDTQITSYRALSEEAKASVDRIDTHTYQGSSRFMLSSLAFTEGKGLWMSEVDGGEVLGRDAGEMGAALWLAQRVVDDMNGLQPSAWILWQVIDSHVSDAGMNGNQDTGMVNVNGGFWGLSVADHDKGTLIHTMKYYALGQFTRFIRPGYELLSSSERSLAARNPENGTVSFVYVNSGNRDRSVTLDLSVFGEEWTCTVYRTSGGMEQGEHWAEAGREETDSGRLEISFAAQAVTTLVLTPKE